MFRFLSEVSPFWSQGDRHGVRFSKLIFVTPNRNSNTPKVVTLGVFVVRPGSLHFSCAMIPSSFAEKFSNIWNIRKDVLSLQQERVKHLIVKNYVYRNIIL